MLLARIAVEILVGGELRGVDENRRRDVIRAPPALFDQGHMPGVECPHGRHQRQPPAGGP